MLGTAFVFLTFILCGIIIYKCFDWLNMPAARNVFFILFSILVIYIPVIIGSRLLMNIFVDHIIESETRIYAFVYLMNRSVFATIPYFTIITVVFAAVAIIMFSTLVLLSTLAACCLVKLILRAFAQTEYIKHNAAKGFSRFDSDSRNKGGKVFLCHCRLNC